MTTMMNELSMNEMLSVLGCNKIEMSVLNDINKALANHQLPDFSHYNNFVCECRTDECSWSEAHILRCLRECGIWQKIEEILEISEQAPNANLKAERTEQGINVPGYGTFPYVGEYDNYRRMDEDAEMTLSLYKSGYVCRVRHNQPNEFVLMLPDGESRYLLVG